MFQATRRALLLLALLALSVHGARAQVALLELVPTRVVAPDTDSLEGHGNVLKINTLSLLLGTGSVFYERRIQEDRSAQMGLAFLRYTFEETTFSGLILTPEYRYYPKGNAISGFFMAPYGRMQQFTVKSEDNKGVYRNLGGGFLFGRQWITRSDFTMDLFLGAHYGRGTINVDNGEEEDFETESFEGIRGRVGFAIGFAF